MISSLTDDRSGVCYASATSLNVDVALTAVQLAMPSRNSQENDPDLILTRRSAQVPLRRSHARAEQSVTSVMAIRRLGLRPAS
jgi:hypothetical protein